MSNMVATVGARLQLPLVLPEHRFHEHYEQRLALPLPLVTDLKPDQVSRFVEQGADLPGCDLEVAPLRFYPQGSAAAHLLGNLRRDDRYQEETAPFHYRLPDFSGMVGVEGTFDPQVRGQPGMKSVLVNNLGYRQSESIWNPPAPGQNVRLTIDIRLQLAAERALRSAGAEARGAAVVMDVRNGDVLAMVSHPAFDPNLFVPRITDADWQRLNDPVLLPMINRATYGAYAPGSIFKIVVGLAGLEAGVIHPEGFQTEWS